MDLQITADKVKEAAAKCPQAEATLKTLFPEVFKEDKYFDLTANKSGSMTVYYNEDFSVRILIADGLAFNSKLANKIFHLGSSCNWELERVDGNYFLIPTKKQ